jgi:NAD kinase
VVRVEVVSGSEDLVLTVDGQTGEELHPGDRLVVRRGEAEVKLIRFEDQSFFTTLRRKLHWGIAQPPGTPIPGDPVEGEAKEKDAVSH